MSERRDRDTLLARTDADLDAMLAPVARAVVAAVRRYAIDTGDGPRITPLARARIMIEVDALLRPIYGRWQGDTEAALYRIITEGARAGVDMPIEAAVADVRRRLAREPELLVATEGRTDEPSR